jgi:PAS domain S-box-containing protein
MRIRGNLLVFALALLGAALARERVAPGLTQAVIWLPSGIAVAGLWILGLRAWWVVALATVAHRLTVHYNAAVYLPEAAGSALEGVLGALVLRRCRVRGDFARLRDVGVLFVAAALAPVASIAVTWAGRSILGTHPFAMQSGWSGWWRMNAVGILTAVPVALTWHARPRRRVHLRAAAEAGVLALAVIGIVLGVMVFMPPGTDAILLLHLVVPVALYAATQSGVRGAASVAAFGALTVALVTAHGSGPFMAVPLPERHVALQIFEFTLLSVPLVVGALVAERATGVARWQRSEGHRDALLRLLPDITYRIAVDGTVLDMVVPAGVQPPLPREQVIGKQVADFIPATVASGMLESIAVAHLGGRPDPVEYRLEVPGGALVREARFVGLGDGEVLCLARDITERKRAEQQLAWQAEVLELVATGRPAQDVFGAIVRGAEAFVDGGRCSLLLLHGQCVVVACAPSLPREYKQALEGLEIGAGSGPCGAGACESRTVVVSDIATDPQWAHHRELALAHGLRACWWVPVRSPAGAVFGMCAVYLAEPRTPSAADLDVVERAAVLAGVAIDRERREELLASIQRNVKEGIYRAVPGRGLVYGNEAFARMFGYESPAALLRAAASLGQGEHEDDLRRLAAGFGSAGNEEARFHRRDGSVFWGLVSSTAVVGAGGAVQSHDGAIADVTARKELEEQLRQAQKMEAVGKLAGGVAHDFNNQLTAIAGFVESARAAAGPASSVRADLEEVLRAADRASSLTRQLLAFSRQQVLSPRVLDLGDVVEELGGMLRRLIGEDVELTTRLAPIPCTVRADRGQIEQVLLNLTVNARDAMPDGGTLAIAVEPAVVDERMAAAHVELTPGSYIALSVRDSGVGMTREVQARAFDPFFTTKEQGKGTGLGLSTVYGIVRQSEGAVWLDSVPGAGTTVWIYLPRVAGEAEKKPVTPAPRPAGRASVLVVEDEPLVRELLQRILARGGYSVRTANDGQHALELGADGVDLLITDVVMPRLGGRELAARLGAMRPGLPVLFLSGYARDNQLVVAEARGPADLLQKPFSAAQLLERTASLLAAAAARSGDAAAT